MQFWAKPLAKSAAAVAFSTAVALLAWLFMVNNSLPEAQLYSIVSAIVTIAITSLGFIFTAASIFAALFTKDLVQKLMKTGHYKQLVTLMFSAGVLFLLAAISAVVAMFATSPSLEIAASTAIGVITVSLILFCIAGYRFYLVLSHIE